ncbi:MAG: hypothetical protein WCT04_03835 [Planctomycetota bacterium]
MIVLKISSKILVLLIVLLTVASRAADAVGTSRLLYVSTPGIRNDLKYGGHGILVFDMDHDYKFVKRIPTHGLDEKEKPINVKGFCASKELHCVFISTTKTVECIDLLTEKSLWEKPYEGGCDRMSISQDSKFMYLPSFEKDHWHVVDPEDGSVIGKVEPKSGAHNTLISLDGSKAFLAGLKSKVMTIADCSTHKAASTITFSNNVRPFTMNGKGTLIFACLNSLLGFEIGDVASGKMIARLEVPGFEIGKVARHGCPSHGIGLTPDEKEIWVTDAHNKRLHIYDMTVMPPKYVESIEVRDEPGWVTFSIDGRVAIPSTGDIIDVKSRKIVARLTDETGAAVQSEKLLEVDRDAGGAVLRVGDQFGFGRLQK